MIVELSCSEYSPDLSHKKKKKIRKTTTRTNTAGARVCLSDGGGPVRNRPGTQRAEPQEVPALPSGWDGLGGSQGGEAGDVSWVQSVLEVRRPGAAVAALPDPLLHSPPPAQRLPHRHRHFQPPFPRRDQPQLPAEPPRSASWRSS